MRSSSLLVGLCLLCCGVSVALGASNTQHETAVRTPPATPRSLVVVESLQLQQTHSTFFSMLKARGHTLDFVVAGEPAVAATNKLAAYGAALFDNVIVMAPAAEDLGDVASLDSLQRFVDMGRSVLLVGGVSVAEPMRELLSELMNIDVDEEGTRVQDHGAFVTPSNDDTPDLHDLVLGSFSAYAQNFVGGSRSKLNTTTQQVLFRGLGHVAQASHLVTPVLAGSPTALSYALGKPLVDYPAAAGKDVLMVSALQTRSNARVVYAGSIDMFSNEVMTQTLPGAAAAAAATAAGSKKKPTKNANQEFARELTAWTFGERGLIRASKLAHYKVGAEHDVNPTSYRVQDNIVFNLVLEEYNGMIDSWIPFHADDIQLEFTMLDPYLRIALPQATGSGATPGLYRAAFQVPDVYGVYKFVVQYPRAGLSNLEVAAQVSVHPFRHDEFERFILVAAPYYTAAFTIMAAFFGFGVVFLYQKE